MSTACWKSAIRVSDQSCRPKRMGELVAVNWDVVAESRIKLRLCERALSKMVADQLRALDAAHYELACPWFSTTKVPS